MSGASSDLAEYIRCLSQELRAQSAAAGEVPYNGYFQSIEEARLFWLCLKTAQLGTDARIPQFPGDRRNALAERHIDSTSNIFQAVKAAISVAELASMFTSLKPAGTGKIKGRCPLHSEKTPSFVIWTDREPQTWRCFGACARGGDVITLAQALADRKLI